MRPQSYPLRLTVTDDLGGEGSDSVVVNVVVPPPPPVVTPAARVAVAAGDVLCLIMLQVIHPYSCCY